MSSSLFVCPYCGQKFSSYEENWQQYCPKCGRKFDAQHQPVYDQVGTSWGNAGTTFFKIIGYIFLFVFLTVFLNVFGIIIFIILVILFHYTGKKLTEPTTYTCPYCGHKYKGKLDKCPKCNRPVTYIKK